ncbi:MAG: type II toxin-antitoxin system prevent-host-death family antitoxin [Acidimicrobiales bacterium]
MPTQVVNTHEAESRLSELIRAAEEGDEVIIARNGRPVARIVPWQPVRPRRQPGAWAGQVVYRGDVVGPDDEVAAAFGASAASDTP